jgi:hypothetical protein
MELSDLHFKCVCNTNNRILKLLSPPVIVLLSVRTKQVQNISTDCNKIAIGMFLIKKKVQHLKYLQQRKRFTAQVSEIKLHHIHTFPIESYGFRDKPN